MVKTIIASAILMTSVSGFAATSINDFIGTYQLADKKVEGDTFCFSQITINQEDDGTIGIYREDTSYGPMINAELNGSPRKNSASHGEAMSSRKGKDSVTLKNDVLTFEYSGTTSLLGVPVGRESDTISAKLAQGGKSLAVTRTTFEGPIAGIGKKGKALCAYTK